MVASPRVVLQPSRLPGQAGFLSHHCPCDTTLPSCCWQTAAGTPFLESRCLRAFRQQTLLCWALVGLGDIPGAPSSSLSTPLSTTQSGHIVNIWLGS